MAQIIHNSITHYAPVAFEILLQAPDNQSNGLLMLLW
jgi:hypothetical protein